MRYDYKKFSALKREKAFAGLELLVVSAICLVPFPGIQRYST